MSAVSKDEIVNMCYTISVEGLHSEAYAKAVYDNLSKAAASGKRSKVIESLAEMAANLEQGKTFW